MRGAQASRAGACRLAAADWVITTPQRFVEDIDLHRAITWRRVIADEAHQLTAKVPTPEKGAKRIEAAVMTLLSELDVRSNNACYSS